MCCDDKCMFFIKVRTGSLIFGYINAVITGFGVLGLLIGQAITLTGSMIYYGQNIYGVWLFIYLSVSFVQAAAAFTCTVLLLFGIHENKPAFVKTYVIYGMFQLIILIGLMITLFIVCVPVAGIMMFLGCSIYLLILYMVYLTYKEMKTSESNAYSNPPNILLA